MQRKHLIGLAVVAALASLGAYAQQQAPSKHEIAEAVSPDLPAHHAQAPGARAVAARVAAAKAAELRAGSPTVDDVYDVDSFGRNVVWLGLASAFVTLSDTCPTSDPVDPSEHCQVLNPAPATTSFSFEDTAHIYLPAKSANSLLCYWFSPVLNVTYSNPGATPALGRLRYNPTLTIENAVLDNPALIDPTTGVPFGGKLLTAMTSSETLVMPLNAGQTIAERSRDSTVCMAGFVSKQALMDNYGLTEAQAKEFFKRPTKIRLNVSGFSQNVGFASMIFGLRVVGDER